MQEESGADWIPVTKQPIGVLVHGGLRSAQLPRNQDGIQ